MQEKVIKSKGDIFKIFISMYDCVDNNLIKNEDMEFYRKKWDFLENYFNKELSDLSKGEIFIVTNKSYNT